MELSEIIYKDANADDFVFHKKVYIYQHTDRPYIIGTIQCGSCRWKANFNIDKFENFIQNEYQ